MAKDANYYRAQSLRSMINKLGWTQKRTALQLGVTERTLRYWLSGTTTIAPMVIFAMRYILEHHPDESHGTARTHTTDTQPPAA